MKKPTIAPNCQDCACPLSLDSFTPTVRAVIVERGLSVRRCPKCILETIKKLINEIEDEQKAID
jgi:Zn-finger protein